MRPEVPSAPTKVFTGTRESTTELVAFAHQELRTIAHGRLLARQRGRAAEPLTTESLVHDAHLALVDRSPAKWRDRSSFTAIAAIAIRELLLECAHARIAEGRSRPHRLTLNDGRIAPDEQADAFLQLDAAVTRLGEVDHHRRIARIAECRIFGGSSEDEISVVLGDTVRSVRRDWIKARVMLRQAIDVTVRARGDALVSAPSPDWAETSAIVDALLDTPHADRPALIVDLTQDDPERQSELEQMLNDIEHEPALFSQPAVERFVALLEQDGARFPRSLADRFAVLQELSSTRRATSYRARELRASRDVVVKVLEPEAAESLGDLPKLAHRHILPVLETGTADGSAYVVEGFEAGQTLQERLDRGDTISVDEAVSIMRDVCDALAHAHGQGVTHLDLKPENVLLARGGALVADFESPTAMPTPAYMAPEQLVGGSPVDYRSDVFSLGVLAYQLLTGRLPFGGGTKRELIAAHLTEVAVPVAQLRSDVPDWLELIVMKCLQKRQDDRWATTDELLTAIERAEHGSPTARRTRMVMATAVLVGAVAVSSVAVWRLLLR